MSMKEIFTEGGGLLLIALTVVQLVPIKINPWSWIAKTIGRAVNAELSRERTADGHRAQILHFNNELLRNIDHTKEEFVEVLTEIDAYESYCKEHPEYPNNRAVLAIENIQDNYKERLQKHDFLQEGTTV